MPPRKIVVGQKIAPQKLQRAKQLRREMTPEEEALWQAMRRDALGVHFRRQQLIAGYIVDFYCDAASLVVELDGGIHKRGEQKASDLQRDQVLREMGLRVLRFKNEAVKQDLGRVLDNIRALLRT